MDALGLAGRSWANTSSPVIAPPACLIWGFEARVFAPRLFFPNSRPGGLAVLSDNSVVIAGPDLDGNGPGSSAVVAKFNSTGAIDTSFGTLGERVLAGGGGDNNATTSVKSISASQTLVSFDDDTASF